MSEGIVVGNIGRILEPFQESSYKSIGCFMKTAGLL